MRASREKPDRFAGRISDTSGRSPSSGQAATTRSDGRVRRSVYGHRKPARVVRVREPVFRNRRFGFDDPCSRNPHPLPHDAPTARTSLDVAVNDTRIRLASQADRRTPSCSDVGCGQPTPEVPTIAAPPRIGARRPRPGRQRRQHGRPPAAKPQGALRLIGQPTTSGVDGEAGGDTVWRTFTSP